MSEYKFEVLDHSFIVIENDGAGTINTSLHDEIDWERDDPDEKHEKTIWNTYVNAIESLILAHACAGIDVGSREYREGIQVALESFSARF